MQMARDIKGQALLVERLNRVSIHFCQSNLSRKGQNLDTKTVDFDDSGSL